MGGDRGGQARPGGGADRVGQDAQRVPVEHRPAAHRDRARRQDQAHAGCSTSARSRRSRSTSSATSGRRSPGSGTPQQRLGDHGARGPGRASGPATRPPGDRRKLVTAPPDIMITTPESLFLMLTSQARESLRGVQTVIVDEVHAVAGTKRGAHLAVSLERLDALLDKPAQRIGLSRDRATARRGGPVPGRQRAGRDRGTAEREAVGPQGRRAGRGHDRARRLRRGLRGSAKVPVDLAARRGARRRPDRAAQQHDRVRQLPAAVRTADGTAQRDRHRTLAVSTWTPTRPRGAEVMAQSGAHLGAATRDRRRRTTAR